jgi:decaprenylphospho-beta-D-ribofuranose 2-oxidase
VVDGTALAEAIEFDASTGILKAGAGLSVADIIDHCLPLGWFVPVTPGTRFVTLGGALAADVHGKNHHLHGSIAQHVRRFGLLTPAFGAIEVTPTSDPALFWATAGGLGLTGVITWVELQMKAVSSPTVLVDTERCASLEHLMAAMSERDQFADYSVAWIDLAARGASLGRGVLTRGSFGPPGTPQRRPYPSGAGLTSPVLPLNVVSRPVVSAFNVLWFAKARPATARPTSIGSFFYPLDGLAHWNRLYGPKGFLQYQTVVPFGAEAVIEMMVDRLSQAGASSFLAVLKRFGPGNRGPMSFPMPGWTLALDLAGFGTELDLMLMEFDRAVTHVGGRTYLAKDSRMDPALLADMYPRLNEWREAVARVDPTGVMASDQSVRLGLTKAQVG